MLDHASRGCNKFRKGAHLSCDDSVVRAKAMPTSDGPTIRPPRYLRQSVARSPTTILGTELSVCPAEGGR